MVEGILRTFAAVCGYVWWIAPFSFVFCLVYAVRDAVNGGERDVAYALGAAVSLLVLATALLAA